MLSSHTACDFVIQRPIFAEASYSQVAVSA